MSVTSYNQLKAQRKRLFKKAAAKRIPAAIEAETALINRELRAREQTQLRRELLQTMRETARVAYPHMPDKLYGRRGKIHVTKWYGYGRRKGWYVEYDIRVLGHCHHADPRFYVATEGGRVFYLEHRPLETVPTRVGFHSAVTNQELRSIIRNLRKRIPE